MNHLRILKLLFRNKWKEYKHKLIDILQTHEINVIFWQKVFDEKLKEQLAESNSVYVYDQIGIPYIQRFQKAWKIERSLKSLITLDLFKNELYCGNTNRIYIKRPGKSKEH